MKRWCAIGLLVCVLVSVTGCGTVANFWPGPCGVGGKWPYGGVGIDVAMAAMAPVMALNPSEPTSLADRLWMLVLAPCGCALDLPFSFVADTLTLPFTVKATFSRLMNPAPEAKPVKETEVAN